MHSSSCCKFFFYFLSKFKLVFSFILKVYNGGILNIFQKKNISHRISFYKIVQYKSYKTVVRLSKNVFDYYSFYIHILTRSQKEV